MKIFDKVTTLIQQKIVPDFLLHARSPKLSPSWSIKNSADVVLKKKSCFGFLFFESLRRPSSRKYKFPKKTVPRRPNSLKNKFLEYQVLRRSSSQRNEFPKDQVSKVPSFQSTKFPKYQVCHQILKYPKHFGREGNPIK